MNKKKGFVITGLIYSILTLFLVILFGLIALLANRRSQLNTLVKNVNERLSNIIINKSLNVSSQINHEFDEIQSANNFTVTFWVNIKEYSETNQNILSLNDNNTSVIDVSLNRWNLNFESDNLDIEENKWYFIAMTKDTNNFDYYINGKKHSVTDNSTNNLDSITIGDDGLSMLIDEILIYDKYLDSKDIEKLSRKQTVTGSYIHWNFDELNEEGNIINKAVLNSNDLYIASNELMIDSPKVSSRRGYIFKNGYVELNEKNIDMSESTINFWFKTNKKEHTTLFYNSNYSYKINLNSDGNLVIFSNEINQNICDNKWHMLSVIITNNNLKVFLDGEEQIDAVILKLTRTDYIIGIDEDSSNESAIIMSDFGIYKTALSNDDINSLYAGNDIEEFSYFFKFNEGYGTEAFDGQNLLQIKREEIYKWLY